MKKKQKTKDEILLPNANRQKIGKININAATSKSQ